VTLNDRRLRILVGPLVAAAGTIAVCMVLFRNLSWSWMPHAAGDRWGVAGVFGVVVGGAVTAWAVLEPGSSADSEGSAESGPEEPQDGGRIRIRRTGKATARGGGQANTGVTGSAAGGRARIGRTGDAEAHGSDSVANSGMDLR
jgi:hypothetical protein